MDENAKLARCHLIAGVIAADDIVTSEERGYLDRIMAHLGLDEAQRQEVLDEVDTPDASFEAATLPYDDRREILDDLVTAAMVDGHFHPAEEEYILRVAKAMRMEDDFFTGLHKL